MIISFGIEMLYVDMYVIEDRKIIEYGFLIVLICSKWVLGFS